MIIKMSICFLYLKKDVCFKTISLPLLHNFRTIKENMEDSPQNEEHAEFAEL